ncbi:MAG: TetR/AcrR family transcriptional regulator [Bacteroidetes bacterium]|nr:TetR/AcrR family transcriptional regulator [Bacteroidota bacterium]
MAAKKKPTVTAEQIVSLYTDFVLKHGKKPSSVYSFMSEAGFSEADFYLHYASFEAIEAAYFSELFAHSFNLIQKSDDFAQYDAAQKLSSFYFTFIEMATANRSMVLYLLQSSKNPLSNLEKLKPLRRDFLNMLKQILQAPMQTQSARFNEIQAKLVHEGAWIQLMSILKFWMDDTSAGFEKTDVFIEKSVQAAFDLVYNSPMQSVVDLGKFLWKEKMTQH